MSDSTTSTDPAYPGGAIMIRLESRHDAERVLAALDIAGHKIGLWPGLYQEAYDCIAAQLPALSTVVAIDERS